MTTTNELYTNGLFTSKLHAPQVVDLTAAAAWYGLRIVQQKQTLHDGTGLTGGLPVKVPVWGYIGPGVTFSSPGPVLLTKASNPISVSWKNNLPTSNNGGQSIFPFKFLTPLPPSLSNKYPTLKAEIITHTHGAVLASGSDGFPLDLYGPGSQRTHHYQNNQPAATIWYHDHAMDQTGLNVYAGIAGGYVITDQTDKALSNYLSSLGGNGPGWAETFGHGVAGIPLVIQDRLLTDNGKQFFYQTNYDDSTPNANGINVGTGGEFFGVINIVNGQVWPKVDIAPTALRLKFINGCNSRFLYLCFTDALDNQVNVPIYHIGDDHGRRNIASNLTGMFIRLGPGERLDIIADFSGFSGQKIRLVDIGSAPFSGTVPTIADIATKRSNASIRNSEATASSGSDNYPEIMLFEVAATMVSSSLNLDIINRILMTGNAVRTRVIALREFVMYMENPSMKDYVERCSTNDFNNGSNMMPNAMLVLEELVPANPGDPVLFQSNIDLFDLNNTPGTFSYKVAGNTAGTLDSTYSGGILRYKLNMSGAWLNNPLTVATNSTEVWRFVNLTGDTHPMHVHLVGYHIVDSSNITFTDTGNGLISTLAITSSAVLPNLPDHLQGFKDTVQVDPSTILSLVAKFEGGTGQYVYHCHMLEHEDHMMMRRFKVV